MSAAAFLAIWAGLDEPHSLGSPPPRRRPGPEFPEPRVWTEGRWRAAFGRDVNAPRRRQRWAARRHHGIPRPLTR